MNKTTSKIIQISDLVQWYNKNEIILSPKYQRNNVWNESAKSYLMDTIIRGLPIPPIFMRQMIDVKTKSTSREIIDGQQRVRAIIEYIVDEQFEIKNNHNKIYGGKKYSELEEDVKEEILGFEILAEVVSEKDDSTIYDMFARLNSNNYVLNKQEIRNAKYWGDFKVLVYKLSKVFREFFLNYGIFTDKECTRMKDVELVNSLVILTIEGIVGETATYVDKIYSKYDKEFHEASRIEEEVGEISKVISMIYEYYEAFLGCLKNKNYFFTLFAVVYHQYYGIKNEHLARREELRNTEKLRTVIGKFLTDYERITNQSSVAYSSDKEWDEFLKNHTIRTTGKKERVQRITFMNKYFLEKL